MEWVSTISGIRIQRPDLTHPDLTVGDLKRQFSRANQLKGGDLNARVRTKEDAARVMNIAFGSR